MATVTRMAIGNKGEMSMENQTIQLLADELLAARAEVRAIARLTDRFPDLPVQDAYAVQLLNIERRIAGGARIVGKKIGLTSEAMQVMLGVNEPDYGILLDDMVVAETAPVDTRRLIAPRIEAELAFILKDDIADAPNATLESVLAATAFIVPSFEIIDSAILNWKMKIQDTIADNASSAALVLGKNKLPVAAIPDLAGVRMVFRKNGIVIDEGVSSAVMGHPAAAVAWLANKLHEFGIRLKAGEIILSGSLTKAYEVAAGDTFSAEFAGIGTAKAIFG